MSGKRIFVVTERCIFWDRKKAATHIRTKGGEGGEGTSTQKGPPKQHRQLRERRDRSTTQQDKANHHSTLNYL